MVRYVDLNTVTRSLVKYLDEYMSHDDLYAFTERQAKHCVDYWLASSPSIPIPRYLGEKSYDGLCFHRLNFDYTDTPKETLVLDEFVSRCTNQAALRQFIGSLTVENSSRTQYLWIYGAGGEGKGSLGRGLMEIFRDSGVTIAVPKTDSQKQFVTHSLQGKRICIFPECNSYQFPNDALFKQWTGNDHVWIEQKGKMGFSGRINTKFIFFSNEQPGVHGSEANMRRMIYCEVAKPTVKYAPAVYDALIAAEMPSFLIKCRNEYLEANPHNEDITITDNTTKELIDMNEERFEVLTDKWLVPAAEGTIAPARMQEIKSLEKMSESEYRRWLSYLKNKLGVHSVMKGPSDKRIRTWIGVRERNMTEDNVWREENGLQCTRSVPASVRHKS